MTRLAFALLLSSLSLPAQDSQLAALRGTVLSLRQHPEDHREIRGATPELTVAKHQLRDWIESRLSKFPERGDEAALAGEFHARIRESHLFCDDDNDCVPSALGFLDEVQVSREREFLVVETAVGIWCGYDYSAYVYQWAGNRWQRVFEDEQDTYTAKNYVPQILHAVHISAPGGEGDRLVMTLGSKPGCASAFQPVYYRVWRMRDKRLLLDKTETSNVDGDPPIRGVVAADDILVGFTAGGTGYGYAHKAVRHFEVRGGSVKQTDPIAVTPRDFVEEWLTAPWTQSAARSDSPGLRQWHRKLHRTDGMGDFPDPPLHCASRPELWQVSTHLHDAPKTYYLVHWRAPYRFTMAAIGDNPYPDCTEPDPKGEEYPALFP